LHAFGALASVILRTRVPEVTCRPALPQIAAALAGPPSGELVDGANHAQITAPNWMRLWFTTGSAAEK
jgi:hypothetical protein